MQTVTFGTWLSDELKKRDLKQADLYRAIGKSSAFVAQMIGDMAKPSPATATKIATFLGIPESEVHRRAGISTTRSTSSPFIEEIIEFGGKLPIEDQQDILDYIKAKLARKQRDARNPKET